MRIPMRAARRIGLFSVVLFVLLSLGATPAVVLASGPSPKPTPDSSLPQQSDLHPQAPSGSGSAAITLGVNPYGCYSQSDYPHLSTTSGGTQTVAYGWTKCAIQQPYEEVQVWLYRWDCVLGVFCRWTQVGYANVHNSYINPGQVRGVAAYTCNGSTGHDYLVQTYSKIVDASGTTYDGWSSNKWTVMCG